MKNLVLFFVCLNSFCQAPTLYGDLQTRGNTELIEPININGYTYFTADDGFHGQELWRTDGNGFHEPNTPFGTFMVTDINPGIEGSFISELTKYGNSLYFSAYSAQYGLELWRTDTNFPFNTSVIDINENEYSSSPTSLTVMLGTLYFIASDGTNTGLYRSDGTSAGTTFIKDIGGEPYVKMQAIGNTLYMLVLEDNFGQNQLWKSDGTTEGTVMVKTIGESDISFINHTIYNGELYFATTDGTNTTLWRSDGTTVGTIGFANYSGSVMDFDNSSFSYLYFSTNSGIFLTTPGQNVPTQVVSGPTESMKYHNGFIYYFIKNVNTQKSELWKANTTGTYSLLKVFEQAESISDKKTMQYAGDGITLFFNGHSQAHGEELWKTDGTSQGTEMVKNIRSGIYESNIKYLTVGLGSGIIFWADDGTTGLEPYISDGTEANTVLLKDIKPNAFDSYPANFTKLNDKIFFTANSGESNALLYVGTPPATPQFVGYYPINTNFWGLKNSSNLLVFNNKIFLSAEVRSPTTIGVELFETDGVSYNITKDILPGTASSHPANLTSLGNIFLFTATESTGLRELWKSDGTTTGTNPIGYTKFTTLSSNPRNLTVVGGSVAYFFAIGGAAGEELWRTGGIPANTQRITIAGSGPIIDPFTPMGVLNNEVFFSASSSFSNFELWKSDGVQAILVKEINAGSSESRPYGFTTMGSYLYFGAKTAANGYELFRTDGTTKGTHLVKDIRVGTQGSFPLNLTVFNNILYFTANDGLNGDELWRSDGTPEGTYMLKNIHPTSDANISSLCVIGNGLYFSATDCKHGAELWKTDGTTSGTVLVYNTFLDYNNQNINNANPTNLFNMNGSLLYSAKSGMNGIEPHLFTPCTYVSKNIPKDDLLASQTLHTTQSIVANNNDIIQNREINYFAANSVTLNPGFKVDSGIIFRAEIKGCF